MKKLNIKSCLYSKIQDVNLFDRVGFYKDDLQALRCFSKQTLATNSLISIIKFRPQLLVTYFYTYSLFAIIIGRLIGAKIIVTGGADQISPKLVQGKRLCIQKIIAFLCLCFAHRVLVSCTDDFNNFNKITLNFKFLNKKITLINHIVNSPFVNYFYEGKNHHKFSAFTIAWMGAEGNVKRKGVDRSIKLISMLRTLNVDASLKIAGTDGPGRAYLEKIISDLNLSNFVHFIGPISDEEKHQQFMHNNAYLQLSEYEGFGVAAAEALFSGMTVVHSNKGGLRDVIGHNGLILDLEIIDQLNYALIADFYFKFKKFVLSYDLIYKNKLNYSTKMRSNAFLKIVNV